VHGSVNYIDAPVDRAVDDVDRIVDARRTEHLTNRSGTEGNGRDVQSGPAQRSRLHADQFDVAPSDPQVFDAALPRCSKMRVWLVWHSAGVSAAPAAAPSGVVTFLFTDVEGSTRRWEADADGMRAALAAHDEVLRAAIEAHGGWLFKHAGDGVRAAFASPRSAVGAAVAAQRKLELPVRMGLATGEAEPREADYFGAVLNRAARVMATGHGGQILLAESTACLLSDVDLVDLGPPQLWDG
jgi:class 3 adenylate cyclase